ncbi:MAG: IS630 family transposase [Cyanobacteria bacterium P01_D01_bin.71]
MNPSSRLRDRRHAAYWSKELILREDWVILDTETTGLQKAEIVQIGVLSGDGEVLLNSLVRPTIQIPHEAGLIHGITDDLVKNAPEFPEIYLHLVDVTANKAVVIYNAKFDQAILKYCCKLASLELPKLIEVHCAMHWYSKWISDWSDYYGNYRWLKLPGGDHSAIGDCYAALELIKKMAVNFDTEFKESNSNFKKLSSQSLYSLAHVETTDLLEYKDSAVLDPKTNTSQYKKSALTNNKSDSLFGYTDRESFGFQLSDIKVDGDQVRESNFIQVKEIVEKLPKRDLKMESAQQNKEEPLLCQTDGSKYICSQKVQTYERAREKGLSQSDASYVAGFSARTGQRIEAGNYRPGRGRLRDWRTRLDPLDTVWESDLVPLMLEKVHLNSVQLLKYLQEQYPGQYDETVLRTLQRRVRSWRLSQGLLRPTKPDIEELGETELLVENQLEWMRKLQNGKIEHTEIETCISGCLSSENIQFLLDAIINKPLRYRNRALTILFHLKEIPPYLIAQFLTLDGRTVERYIENYEAYGVKKLLDMSRKQFKKSGDPQLIEKVFEILHAPPSSYGINRTSWTMKDLHRIMAETGFGIAPSNIRQIIRDAGYKFRNAKKVLTSTDPDYREKLQKNTQILSNLGPKDKFFSIDEFGPFSVKIQGGRSLMPPGEVRAVPQWQKSKVKLIMTAALELSSNQFVHFYSEKKDTEEMIKLLDILLEKYADEDCIYLSWDAASWHASHELCEKVDLVNSSEYRNKRKIPIVKLAPLPASAQFLNIIESVFSGMAKAIIHNSNYQSVEECKEAVDRYFCERNRYFLEHPKRAGKKIWGEELVKVEFKESNNCKDPRYR